MHLIKYYIVIVFYYFFYTHDAFCQIDTQWNVIKFISTIENAKYQVKKPIYNSLHPFFVYDSNNILRCNYHSRDTQGNVFEGNIIFYDKKGSRSIEGTYSKGYKSGIWIYYFVCTNKIKEIQEYTDIEEYNVKIYDSLYDFICEEYAIDKYGKKNGNCIQYHYKSDSIKNKGLYISGKKDKEHYEYFKNGNVKRLEYYEQNKLKWAKMFNENGESIKYYPAFEFPTYKEFINNFLFNRLPCAYTCAQYKPYTIHITIDNNGKVTKVNIDNIEDEACAKKIEETIMKMKKWKPAKIENKPITYTLKQVIKTYSPRE